MILITGGGGFYGRNIARYLLDRGKEVLLLQRSPVQVTPFLAPFWDKQLKAVKGDVVNLPHLMSLVKKYNVESIIHLALAADRQGRKSEVPFYQVMQINLQGTINILEAAHIFGLRRVTFASSNTVYFGKNELPKGLYHEDLDVPVLGHWKHTTPSKKAGEQICLMYAKEYNLSVCMIRGGTGYGPGSHGANPPDVMIPNALEGKPVDLTHLPENSTFTPVYIKDLAKGYGLIHLAESPKHHIYNISSGNMYTFSEIARTVKEIIPKADIRLGSPSPEVVPFCPSIERAKEEFGYSPDYADIKKGIMAYIDYLRNGTY